MKKLLVCVLLIGAMLIPGSAKANGVFAKNDLIGSVTVGFGDGFSQRFAVDYGIVDGWIDGKASLGLGASVNNTFGWNAHWDAMSIIANCSFHYQFVENLDTYVVLGVGGGVVFASKNTHGRFDWTSAVGARYYLTNDFALNLEAGHTNGSFINMGVTFRF